MAQADGLFAGDGGYTQVLGLLLADMPSPRGCVLEWADTPARWLLLVMADQTLLSGGWADNSPWLCFLAAGEYQVDAPRPVAALRRKCQACGGWIKPSACYWSGGNQAFVALLLADGDSQAVQLSGVMDQCSACCSDNGGSLAAGGFTKCLACCCGSGDGEYSGPWPASLWNRRISGSWPLLLEWRNISPLAVAFLLASLTV